MAVAGAGEVTGERVSLCCGSEAVSMIKRVQRGVVLGRRECKGGRRCAGERGSGGSILRIGVNGLGNLRTLRAEGV